MKITTNVSDLTPPWQSFVESHKADVGYWLRFTGGDIARAVWFAEVTQAWREPYSDEVMARSVVAHYATERASRLDDIYSDWHGKKITYADHCKANSHP